MSSPYPGNVGASAKLRQLAERQVTAVQVVDEAIGRIDEVNSTTNAVAVRRFDEARAEARTADQRRQAGGPLPPLLGVPITIKECLDLTGTASTFGLQHRVSHRATADDPYVARLRAAGAIVVAKSNVAQLLAFAESDNPVYGRVNNPRDPNRSAGGSSGGEGVLTSTGASSLGVGTDIGGSCRIPAAWCGSVGFKPTAGLTVDQGRYSFARGNVAVESQVGLLAPRAADVELGLSVIAGASILSSATVDLSSMTVGVFESDGLFEPCPATRRAVREAEVLLRSAGVRTVPWQPPAADLLRSLYRALGSGLSEAWKPLLRETKVDRRIGQLVALSRLPLWMNRSAAWTFDRAGQRSLAVAARLFQTPKGLGEYFELVESIQDLRAAVSNDVEQQGIDAILSPATALPAILHGASYDLGLMGSYCAMYNTLGWPAGVVPFTTVRTEECTDRVPGRDRVQKVARASEMESTGLPIAVQIGAPAGNDHVVLALLSALEQHFPG